MLPQRKLGSHRSAAGAADRWVPAFPTDQVPPDQVRGQARAAPGLKAHGTAVWAWFHTLWVGGAGGGLERSKRVHLSSVIRGLDPRISEIAGSKPDTGNGSDRLESPLSRTL